MYFLSCNEIMLFLRYNGLGCITKILTYNTLSFMCRKCIFLLYYIFIDCNGIIYQNQLQNALTTMRINKKITILSLKRISIRQEQGTSILPDQSLGNIFVQIQTLGISQSILVFNFLSNKNLFDSDLNFLAIDGVWNI